MATSREVVRDAVALLLASALEDTGTGAGKPVKTVSSSKVESLEGITPLVVVLSSGSGRERLTYQGDRASFRLLVQTWVRQSAAGWTQAQAEDALDKIEAGIAAVVEENQGTANWETLEYDGDSSIYEAVVAGVPYYVESIPLRAKLAHN